MLAGVALADQNARHLLESFKIEALETERVAGRRVVERERRAPERASEISERGHDVGQHCRMAVDVVDHEGAQADTDGGDELVQRFEFLLNSRRCFLMHAFGFPRMKPVNVTVSTTYRCNSRCLTCNVYERPVDELSAEEWDRAFRSLGRSAQWFTFSGGEPFVRKDLVEIVESACRENNCSRVELVRVRVGRAAGVMTDSLSFSFDAAKAKDIFNLSVPVFVRALAQENAPTATVHVALTPAEIAWLGNRTQPFDVASGTE